MDAGVGAVYDTLKQCSFLFSFLGKSVYMHFYGHVNLNSAHDIIISDMTTNCLLYQKLCMAYLQILGLDLMATSGFLCNQLMTYDVKIKAARDK